MTARNWIDGLRIANPLLLLVAVWMNFDHHRTAALVVMLASLAGQLIAITLENRLEHERWMKNFDEAIRSERPVDMAS